MCLLTIWIPRRKLTWDIIKHVLYKQRTFQERYNYLRSVFFAKWHDGMTKSAGWISYLKSRILELDSTDIHYGFPPEAELFSVQDALLRYI